MNPPNQRRCASTDRLCPALSDFNEHAAKERNQNVFNPPGRLTHYINNTIMSASTNQPKHLQRVVKKRVSFSKNSQVLIVVNECDDIGCRKTKKKLWYSTNEVRSFKVDRKHSIVRARMKVHHQSLGMSKLLGLERSLSADLAREYKQRKRALLIAVQAEQVLQKIMQISDPDRLATVALRHSQWAVERAHATALLLELDVYSLELDAFIFSLAGLY